MSTEQVEAVLKKHGVATTPAPLAEWPGAAISAVEVPGDKAEAIWRALRAETTETGIWPLLVSGGTDLIVEMAEFALEDGVEPSKLLDQAWDIDVDAWLADRRKLAEADDEDDATFADRVAFDDWAAEGASLDIDALGGHRSEGEFRDSIALWLIPTRQGWEVPAHLFLGGWNEVPESPYLVAVLRSWKKRFGADLFSISSDRMEFDVRKPPTDRAAVEALAVEQYLVCADLVDQGYEEISRLASALSGAKAWWFWWD